MGAARAKRRRPGRHLRDLGGLGSIRGRAGEAAERGGDLFRREGEAPGQVARALAQDLDLRIGFVGQATQLVFQERGQLLDDQHAVDSREELFGHAARQRVRGAHGLNGEPVGQPECVDLVEDEGRGRAADEHPFPARAGAGEERRSCEKLLRAGHPLVQLDAHPPGVDGNRVERGRPAVELGWRGRALDRLRAEHATRMRDARRGAQDHRQARLLGEVEREARHRTGLGRGGGLEHREHVHPAEMALVLLVRRDEHARVARRDDDQAGLDTDVGDGAQGIAGVGQPQVLHVAQRAHAHQRGAEGDLQGDLFVDAPLEVDACLFVDPREGVADLGGRRSGIPGDEADPCLQGSPGDGLVAEETDFLPGPSVEQWIGHARSVSAATRVT